MLHHDSILHIWFTDLEASRFGSDNVSEKDTTFKEMMIDIQAILSRYAAKAPSLIDNHTTNLAETPLNTIEALPGQNISQWHTNSEDMLR